MFQELERVALTDDLPGHGVKAGDIGVGIMIHGNHEGYELEIFSVDGTTLDVVTVEAEQVRPISIHDVLYARAIQAS